jgi:hypothetical protein
MKKAMPLRGYKGQTTLALAPGFLKLPIPFFFKSGSHAKKTDTLLCRSHLSGCGLAFAFF